MKIIMMTQNVNYDDRRPCLKMKMKTPGDNQSNRDSER